MESNEAVKKKDTADELGIRNDEVEGHTNNQGSKMRSDDDFDDGVERSGKEDAEENQNDFYKGQTKQKTDEHSGTKKKQKHKSKKKKWKEKEKKEGDKVSKWDLKEEEASILGDNKAKLSDEEQNRNEKLDTVSHASIKIDNLFKEQTKNQEDSKEGLYRGDLQAFATENGEHVVLQPEFDMTAAVHSTSGNKFESGAFYSNVSVSNRHSDKEDVNIPSVGNNTLAQFSEDMKRHAETEASSVFEQNTLESQSEEQTLSAFKAAFGKDGKENHDSERARPGDQNSLDNKLKEEIHQDINVTHSAVIPEEAGAQDRNAVQEAELDIYADMSLNIGIDNVESNAESQANDKVEILRRDSDDESYHGDDESNDGSGKHSGGKRSRHTSVGERYKHKSSKYGSNRHDAEGLLPRKRKASLREDRKKVKSEPYDSESDASSDQPKPSKQHCLKRNKSKYEDSESYFSDGRDAERHRQKSKKSESKGKRRKSATKERDSYDSSSRNRLYEGTRNKLVKVKVRDDNEISSNDTADDDNGKTRKRKNEKRKGSVTRKRNYNSDHNSVSDRSTSRSHKAKHKKRDSDAYYASSPEKKSSKHKKKRKGDKVDDSGKSFSGTDSGSDTKSQKKRETKRQLVDYNDSDSELEQKHSKLKKGKKLEVKRTFNNDKREKSKQKEKERHVKSSYSSDKSDSEHSYERQEKHSKTKQRRTSARHGKSVSSDSGGESEREKVKKKKKSKKQADDSEDSQSYERKVDATKKRKQKKKSKSDDKEYNYERESGSDAKEESKRDMRRIKDSSGAKDLKNSKTEKRKGTSKGNSKKKGYGKRSLHHSSSEEEAKRLHHSSSEEEAKSRRHKKIKRSKWESGSSSTDENT